MPATIWRGRLVFGLVSIPVRLHEAAGRERVQFHNVYAMAPAAGQAAAVAGHLFDAPESEVRQFPSQPGSEKAPLPENVARVHQAFVGEDPKTPLDKDDIFKAYEVEPDRYVVLRSSEVAELRARSSTNLEIAEFVGLDEIDRNYFDASYYVARDQGGEKAYALFYRALVETGCVAIGELVMYGREHAVCIRPGGRGLGLVLHTLFFGHEVRVYEEAPADLGLVDHKELELAKMLVNAQRGKFDAAELKDKFRERVLDVIENRPQAAVAGAAAGGAQRASAPVVDIMDALRKSLDAARNRRRASGPTGRHGRRTSGRSDMIRVTTTACSWKAWPFARRRPMDPFIRPLLPPYSQAEMSRRTVPIP
jgi:DNA end-binding protein Ku